MSEEQQIVFDALAKLIGGDGSKKLRPTGLIAKLGNETKLVNTDIQQALIALSRAGIIDGIDRAGMPAKKVGWIDKSTQPIPVYQHNWHSVVDKYKENYTRDALEALKKQSKLFEGLDLSEMENLLSSLTAFSKQGFAEHQNDRYILSARNILGSSKAIDKLKKLTDILGISLPADNPKYFVLTAGKPNSNQILFVENPRVFSYLAPFCVKYNTLLVSNYGYGITFRNFYQLLQNNQVIASPTDGQKQADLTKLIETATCLYWGDLDYEGISIFDSFRQHLTKLCLSEIYQVMIDRLKQGYGHPYHKLFEKQGQKPQECITQLAQELMDLCAELECGIDQEAFCDSANLTSIFDAKTI